MHTAKCLSTMVAMVGLITSAASPAREATVSSNDCASVKNSLHREPVWYSQQCLGHPYATKAAAGDSSALPNTIGDLTYQFNMRATGTGADSLQSFLLPNANTATVIGPQAGNLYGLEFDPAVTKLWAVSDLLELGELNKTSGVFTSSVTITGVTAGQSPTGLAFQNGSSPFYLSTSSGTDSELYTVNTTTGVATLVGSMGIPLVIDIAINASGQMYAHDISTDSIYTVNTATGATTLIGATGVNANFAQGMEFDKSTGVLYAWLYEGGGVNRFASINLATGAATTVASPLPGEYEGATTPVSLQSFSVD